MWKLYIVFFLQIIVGSFTFQSSFLTEQKKYANVRMAVNHKQLVLEKLLSEVGCTLNNLSLLLIAYKDQDRLDVYVKQKGVLKYTKLTSYTICARSGILGPKVQQGDNQVPEGFYHIDRFNPSSSFYLSLGLNYPNHADKARNISGNWGGDIFIHGSCVTVGCLPMTDNTIKELYVLAMHAKNNGQSKVPVYIFPFEMTEQKFVNYKEKYKDQKSLIDFWSNLKIGHDLFLKEKEEIKVKASDKGGYVF